MIQMVSVSKYLNGLTTKEQDLQVDMSNTTSNAFIKIDSKRSKQIDPILGTETIKNTPFSTRVKVVTPFDEKTHTYFHSMSIDTDIADFMGTAELRCPYDKDLMSYWEPARAYCVIYGTNRGDYKVLFIGRVREVNQQGYEIVISLQNYGWKFKQLITQSYAKDNILNKDGYTIMKLIFQALKIDSWVISPTAKYRLQQVGIDEDGNVTLNKKKVEKMPNLINRLKKTNPKWAINKYTAYNKIKESEVHNVKNINYTLKYEKPTKIMKQTAKQNNYTAGKDIYGTNYGSRSNSGGSGGGSSGSGKKKSSNTTRPPNWVCASVSSSSINSAMRVVWAFNRGNTNSYQSALDFTLSYARDNPSMYKSQISPCLDTMAKWCTRADKVNAASIIKSRAEVTYNKNSRTRVAANYNVTPSYMYGPSAEATKRHRR